MLYVCRFFFVVTGKIYIVQWYCVALEFIAVTSRVAIVQWYCVVLEFIVDTATEGIVQCYSVALEFIVVTATLGIVQCFCAVYVVYCGYSYSRYSAMVVCCVWSLLWLQQQ